MLAFFREAKEVPRLEDPDEVARRYDKLRREALLGSMVAYGFFYFIRKNLSIALPYLTTDLHINDADLGDLNGNLYLAYALSKFASGLVADRGSPRVFMVTGLILAAAANVAFGLNSSLAVFGVVWTVNGVVQSLGAPASAKIVATWFGKSERGTKTAIWNISHQAGGGIALLLATAFAYFFGWRWAFLGPAGVVLLGTLVVARFLHDRPETHGLPPVEHHRNEDTAIEDEARSESFLSVLFYRLLLNPRCWIIALASGCTYIARVGAIDWSTKYLCEARGLNIGRAGIYSSLLEFFGIPGAFLCGWLSDRYLKSRRAPVVFVSLLLLAASLYAFIRVPEHPYLEVLLLAACGFFTYGPQLLLAGVAPVDMSSKRVAAAAIGFTGFVSYLAAWASSKHTGRLIQMGKLIDVRHGYTDAYDFWALAAVVGALLCIPLWNQSGARKGS